MHVTPLTFQFRHFEKNRELARVPKERLDDNQRQAVLDMVDESWRCALQTDNRPGDVDPLEGRLLLDNTQGVISAQYTSDESGRHLQRTTNQHSGFQTVMSAHLREDGMDMAQYVVTPGCSGTLLCYHIDYADAHSDFVQRLNLEPVRPAVGPFPNCSR
ncbi:MAG: hypothetical protein U0931_12110 [Vulcanimicrobiota bacterium]